MDTGAVLALIMKKRETRNLFLFICCLIVLTTLQCIYGLLADSLGTAHARGAPCPLCWRAGLTEC